MNTKLLNPWNWFKHEEPYPQENTIFPVKHGDYLPLHRPMSNMMHLHHEVDRLFEDAFRDFSSFNRSPLWDSKSRDEFMPAFRAKVNVASDDKQYTITLEAPGMEQNDLSIELKDRTLIVKGNKEKEHKEQDKHYYRVERHFGSFERVLSLPDDADAEEINAQMKNGVLTLSMPRKEVAETGVKKIAINS